MVIEFGRIEEDRAASARFGMAAIRRPGVGLELDLRQTPFGIWCARLPKATAAASHAAKRWLRDQLPGLLHRMGEGVAPFDIPGDHELFAVPQMLEPVVCLKQRDGVLH